MLTDDPDVPPDIPDRCLQPIHDLTSPPDPLQPLTRWHLPLLHSAALAIASDLPGDLCSYSPSRDWSLGWGGNITQWRSALLTQAPLPATLDTLSDWVLRWTDTSTLVKYTCDHHYDTLCIQSSAYSSDGTCGFLMLADLERVDNTLAP